MTDSLTSNLHIRALRLAVKDATESDCTLATIAVGVARSAADEIERLQRENTALRNLAENLRPGPISVALGGAEHEAPYRAMAASFVPNNDPPTHQELFSAVNHFAREILRLTDAVPAACTTEPPEASDAEKILMFIYNDQFTSLSREAFQRCFDYYQQQRRASETKNEYRVPSSTPAGETAAAAGAESTADPSIDDEQHTDSLIEKLESVVGDEKTEHPAVEQSAANSEQCVSRKAAQSGTAAGSSDETSVRHPGIKFCASCGKPAPSTVDPDVRLVVYQCEHCGYSNDATYVVLCIAF